MTATTQFVVGQTYTTRSICDHECIYSARVVGRTDKSVKVDLGGRGIKTRRIAIDYDGRECFKPFGSYSMAPTIRA